MEKFIKLIRDKSCHLGIKAFLLLFLFTFTLLLFTFNRLPPQLPLFYSRPWGEEQLATPSFLLLLPLGALVIGFLNIGMAGFLFEEFPFLARILIWSSVLVSLISAITVFKIVTLIT